jgi:hypothetical protein
LISQCHSPLFSLISVQCPDIILLYIYSTITLLSRRWTPKDIKPCGGNELNFLEFPIFSIHICIHFPFSDNCIQFAAKNERKQISNFILLSYMVESPLFDSVNNVVQHWFFHFYNKQTKLLFSRLASIVWSCYSLLSFIWKSTMLTPIKFYVIFVEIAQFSWWIHIFGGAKFFIPYKFCIHIMLSIYNHLECGLSTSPGTGRIRHWSTTPKKY